MAFVLITVYLICAASKPSMAVHRLGLGITYPASRDVEKPSIAGCSRAINQPYQAEGRREYLLFHDCILTIVYIHDYAAAESYFRELVR